MEIALLSLRIFVIHIVMMFFQDQGKGRTEQDAIYRDGKRNMKSNEYLNRVIATKMKAGE